MSLKLRARVPADESTSTTPALSESLPDDIAIEFKTYDTEVVVAEKLKDTSVKSRAVGSNKAYKVDMTSDLCKTLCAEAGVEYLSGYENRILQYTITDETVDRYGDIVKADGGQFDNYRKNAVIMTFHDYKQFPIGVALKVWQDPEKKQVKAWVLVLDHRVDPTGVSDTAYRMASSGFMKAGSIGFMPKSVYRPTAIERETLGMSEWGVVYTAWELMEFSLCGVPANPNAVQNEVEQGVLQTKDLQLLHKELDQGGDEFSAFFKAIETHVGKEKIKVESESTATPALDLVARLEGLEALLRSQVKGSPELSTQKAGAMLSKKNKELISSAVMNMTAASEALTALLASASDESDPTTYAVSSSTQVEKTNEAESESASIYEKEFERELAELVSGFKK